MSTAWNSPRRTRRQQPLWAAWRGANTVKAALRGPEPLARLILARQVYRLARRILR